MSTGTNPGERARLELMLSDAWPTRLLKMRRTLESDLAIARNEVDDARHAYELATSERVRPRGPRPPRAADVRHTPAPDMTKYPDAAEMRERFARVLEGPRATAVDGLGVLIGPVDMGMIIFVPRRR
jgi:hypothetical protein